MAEGEGRTLEEAFDHYAEQKSAEVIEQQGVNDLPFAEGMAIFEAYHPVEISVKTRPHNQWVKGYKVKDPDR
jgi:hypothetical protein